MLKCTSRALPKGSCYLCSRAQLAVMITSTDGHLVIPIVKPGSSLMSHSLSYTHTHTHTQFLFFNKETTGQ